MNNDKIEIRHAKPEEWRDIRRLNLELMEFEREHFMPTWDLNHPFSTDAKKRYQDACADRNNFNAFVGVQNNEVIGFGLLEHKQDDDHLHRTGIILYYIALLCVSEKHRNQGVGRKLIEHIKVHAKSEGATHLSIGLVHGNDRALHLYKDTGFKDQELILEQKL